MVTNIEEQLRVTEPAQRVLLLPHCLRRAETCQGKYTKQGLECNECNPDCPANQLRQAAIRLGYKGVCIAPGGRLAVKYVEGNRPLAIVAVACQKELQEGVNGVRELVGNGQQMIPIVVIPLSKDGCVNTEVNIKTALEKIALGCTLPLKIGNHSSLNLHF
ncbi:MAG: DUF116 domain-containing protein [Syntrophales bacterium]|jgi:hypothetical protein